MKFFRSGFVALALAALASGCSDSPATPTSPTGGSGLLALTASQISGTWTLVSVRMAGQAERSVPAGATYTLSFADGRFSTRADCNSCSGAYTLAGSTVTLGPNLACTRAACPTMEFETMYTSVLSGEATVTTSGSTLLLTSARGTLSFTR